MAVYARIPFAAEPYEVFDGSGNALEELLPFGYGTHGVPGSGMWDWSHHANGGPVNDCPFMRYHWWDFDLSGDSGGTAGFTQTGDLFTPAGGWPNPGPYYIRFWIRVNAPIIPKAGADADHIIKWFKWNGDVDDGDNRVFLQMGPGSALAGHTDAEGIVLSLEHNIDHNNEAHIFVPADDQWHAVQGAWRHGTVGTGYVKLWLDADNASESTPTHQDTSLGGTWNFNALGYDSQFWWGDQSNSPGAEVDETAEFDTCLIELASTFDPDLYEAQAPVTAARVFGVRA